LVPNRSGSVGSEILRRFSIVFDYSNQNIFLKINGNFRAPFSYNKSGIEIQHNGLQWVQETVSIQTVPLKKSDEGASIENASKNNFKFKFELKPIFKISNIRKNSPAAISGLKKGDIIFKINKVPAFEYSLEKINSLLKSEDEKWITFEVEREGMILIFKFQLLNEL
jgi:S1-C subfamily serine protease